MIRVFVTYEAEPDAARFEQHADLCRQVPGVTFRHGKVLRTLHGQPELHHYAEFEFPDMEAFQAAARSPELTATGADAMEMGIPMQAHFADIS